MFGVVFAGNPTCAASHRLRLEGTVPRDFPLTGYVELRHPRDKRVVYMNPSSWRDTPPVRFNEPLEGADTSPGDEKKAENQIVSLQLEQSPTTGDVVITNYTSTSVQHPAAHGVLRMVLG